LVLLGGIGSAKGQLFGIGVVLRNECSQGAVSRRKAYAVVRNFIKESPQILEYVLNKRQK
jgi:hypothetical protein